MRDIVVLTYHAVSERWPAALSIAPAKLEAQLRLLVRRGYRGATLHEAIHGAAARKTVAITFDDGFRSVLELAFPILSRLGLPATVFVPTRFADTGAPLSWPGVEGWLDGPHARELTPLSWDELRTLRDAGWEIGSHTCSHPPLTRLDDAALERELVESRARCEQQLGVPCRSLAYPYGDHDGRVVTFARAAGYQVACTVPDLLRTVDPLRWPRVGIYHEETPLSFRLKVSRAVRALRRTEAGGRVIAATRALRG